jgi:hypothetical protein
MPPTLAALAGLPQLRLAARTDVSLNRQVHWVAVSELADPTPFLEGGELLLTTGMRLTEPGHYADYVSRLVARGVTGLGFGVGLTHERVPAGLIAVAADQGLPLLEVPRATPFIAVGKALSRMLAAERYEDVTRAFQAQRELTKAAVRGEDALVARLARELGGWALLLDGSGAIRQAAPAAAAARAAELGGELARLRKRAGSIALSGADDHIILQPLGLGGHPRGFLAVGTAEPLPPVAHAIVGAALSLLTLRTEGLRAGRELRATLAALLLTPPAAEGGSWSGGAAGGASRSPAAEGRLRSGGVAEGGARYVDGGGSRSYGVEGRLPEEPVRVVACGGGIEVVEALEADSAGDECLPLPRDGSCAVIVPERLAEQVIGLAAALGPVGVGEPGGLDAAARSREQADQALAAARRTGGVLHYADLPGQGLLALLDPGAARGFAESLLAPLDDPELLDSLRAYLAANGQGEAAARALGVHRHTLRYRMRKVAELLGRDLDDPAVRAELWIALSVR